MEKDEYVKKQKINCVNKLKDGNAKKLQGVLIDGIEEMKMEIREIYEYLKVIWYDKDLTNKEKKQISDFLDIEKYEINNLSIDKLVENYRRLKELIEKQYYIEIAGLKVMKENLRVNSEGWKKIEDVNWVKVKVNTSWDIWEYVEWKYKWEQLYTWFAAIRETHKLWLEILEEAELSKIIFAISWKTLETKKTVEKLNIKNCGFRHFTGCFNSIDKESNHWLQGNIKDKANVMRILDTKIKYDMDYKAFGFSVRCIFQA